MAVNYHRLLRVFDPPIVVGHLTYTNHLKKLLKQIVRGQQVILGVAHFFRICLYLCVALAFTPLSFIAKILGYRFVVVDLSQIGSVLWLDLFLRDDRLSKSTPKSKVLVCINCDRIANRYLLDLYRQCITFVGNPLLKLILSPFFVNPWFHDSTVKYEHTFTFGDDIEKRLSVIQSIYQRYSTKFENRLIGLPKGDIEKGYRLLWKFAAKNRPFVVVHARESGFYGEKWHSLRNSNIHDFEDTFKYLISRGYFVIRVGDNKMQKIDSMIERLGADNIFDYANSEIRSSFMDIFLISEAEFFIGGSSGLCAVPPLLGKNSVNVNFYNINIALGFLDGDLTAVKKYRFLKNNHLVSFSDSVRPPYNRNLSEGEMEKLGIYLEDNSSSEILETVKEYLGDSKIFKELQVRSKEELPSGSFSYQARGNYSAKILQLYYKGT